MPDAIGVKKKIRDGEHVIGAQVKASATREELEGILEKGGFDYLSIDSQHTPFNEEQVAEFCNVAEDLDTFVIFRIRHSRQAYMIGSYLDLGLCGVEVPQTELDSLVEEALHYFYYPPLGGRSIGGGSRRGPRRSAEEYTEWWNSFGVIWLQIESIEATTRAHLWAKDLRVDCVSIGPTDMTYNIKSHPNHELQSVDDCIGYMGKALADTHVKICHRNRTPDTREKYAEMGVTVFLERP